MLLVLREEETHGSSLRRKGSKLKKSVLRNPQCHLPPTSCHAPCRPRDACRCAWEDNIRRSPHVSWEVGGGYYLFPFYSCENRLTGLSLSIHSTNMKCQLHMLGTCSTSWNKQTAEPRSKHKSAESPQPKCALLLTLCFLMRSLSLMTFLSNWRDKTRKRDK